MIKTERWHKRSIRMCCWSTLSSLDKVSMRWRPWLIKVSTGPMRRETMDVFVPAGGRMRMWSDRCTAGGQAVYLPTPSIVYLFAYLLTADDHPHPRRRRSSIIFPPLSFPLQDKCHRPSFQASIHLGWRKTILQCRPPIENMLTFLCPQSFLCWGRITARCKNKPSTKLKLK